MDEEIDLTIPPFLRRYEETNSEGAVIPPSVPADSGHPTNGRPETAPSIGKAILTGETA